jgi:hypothetical protein
MSALDELRFPLDKRILLSQAALWLAEGTRPLPIQHQAKLGLQIRFSPVADSSCLDALFLALASGKIPAWGICAHKPPTMPELAGRRPPDDQISQIPPNWWNDLPSVNWLQSELSIDALGCTFWMIELSTEELLATFPSLARREEVFWRDNLHGQANETPRVINPNAGGRPEKVMEVVAALRELYPPEGHYPRGTRQKEVLKHIAKKLCDPGLSLPTLKRALKNLRNEGGQKAQKV